MVNSHNLTLMSQHNLNILDQEFFIQITNLTSRQHEISRLRLKDLIYLFK
jgi:hypothetical protein